MHDGSRARAANTLRAVIVSCLVSTSALAQPQKQREINISSESAHGWLPSVEQEAQASRVLAEFLAALDSGSFQTAYDLTNDGFKAQQAWTDFAARQAELKSNLGEPLARQTLKVTWSKDPKSAPKPGIYAAVDLSARFSNADRYCGYVILRQPSEGEPFRVNNALAAYLDNETARTITRTQSSAHLEAAWREAASACPNFDPGVQPLPESETGSIGYPTVAAAMSALRDRQGVRFRTENGWTIAEDTPNMTLWSFAPEGHNAYPAAVKRQIVSTPGGTSLAMSILCESAKVPCDALVREFEQLNQRALSGR